MSELSPVNVPLDSSPEPQAETATGAFLAFLKKKRLCDVTFVFENAPDRIEAHQFCLRARSPVLDSQLVDPTPGNTMPEVNMGDASPDIVHKFLQYIYADELVVTTVQALHLLRLAQQFDVKPLVKRCKALIGKGISTDNAIEMYELAETYELPDLRTKAGDFIALSLERFLQDPKMMKSRDTTMAALLSRSDLTVEETDLFQFALDWGQKNSSGDVELSVVLTEILPHIRFPIMTSHDFTTFVLPTNIIQPEDTGYILAYINGDDATRNVILPFLKYQTSYRNVKEFQKTVLFISESSNDESRVQKFKGCRPFKECISFSTKVSTSCHQKKKFKIQSLTMRWPTRRVAGYTMVDEPSVNFRVQIMAKHSSDEFYTSKFDAVQYNCMRPVVNVGCTQDVPIQPPVQFQDDFDYCITVVDEYQSEAEAEFFYHQGSIEATENLGQVVAFREKDLGITIGPFARNKCPKACDTSSTYDSVRAIQEMVITMD